MAGKELSSVNVLVLRNSEGSKSLQQPKPYSRAALTQSGEALEPDPSQNNLVS